MPAFVQNLILHVNEEQISKGFQQIIFLAKEALRWASSKGRCHPWDIKIFWKVVANTIFVFHGGSVPSTDNI